MTKAIPISLQTSRNEGATTECNLLKIVAKDGTVLTITNFNRDLDYDDGDGELTYSSITGMNRMPLSASADLSVDNTDAEILIIENTLFTETAINAGVLDAADFKVYRVDYNNLAGGHENVIGGSLGAVTAKSGLMGVVELRGLSQTLKQSFTEMYSLTCRAAFGSTGKFGCFFDAESLWDAGTIVSVSVDEPDRIFEATTAPSATGPNGALSFVPGVVKFKTGNNAGKTVEIEDIQGNLIYLRHPVAYDIEITDTYDARPDCAKRWEEDCKLAYDNVLNFRGEPHITAGDEASQIMPGASAPAFSFTTNPEVTP